MKSIRVYDWPTRIFHWFFVLSFVAAFLIAKTLDDDSPFYPYHMLLGQVLGVTVFLRILWGVVGSKYARFSSFQLSPRSLLLYFKKVFSGKGERFVGHNPASSWAALVMMSLGLGLGVTGYFMTTGSKELFEEVHELFANLFLVTALVHMGGVIFHTVFHRDPIGLSMLHGRKNAGVAEEGIGRAHGEVGLLFVGLIAGFVFYLSKNYDSNRQTLNMLGTSMQLGENKSHEDRDDD